jgi:3-isopropylmalate dehydratase small subunit
MAKIKTGVRVVFNETEASVFANGSTDAGLVPIKDAPSENYKQLKTLTGSVTVENKFVSVTVYENGAIEIVHHDQVKESI